MCNDFAPQWLTSQKFACFNLTVTNGSQNLMLSGCEASSVLWWTGFFDVCFYVVSFPVHINDHFWLTKSSW